MRRWARTGPCGASTCGTIRSPPRRLALRRQRVKAHGRSTYLGTALRSPGRLGVCARVGGVPAFRDRNLEHSTILYESVDLSPLVRVAWNKLDPNLLATFSMDSTRITVLDVRVRWPTDAAGGAPQMAAAPRSVVSGSRPPPHRANEPRMRIPGGRFGPRRRCQRSRCTN